MQTLVLAGGIVECSVLTPEFKQYSILGSWDAEEFGLQGSTEWVETNLPWLVSSAIAYLNIDVAVSGPRPSLQGSGEIQSIAIETMKKVLFPDKWGVGPNPTLYDMWWNRTEGRVSPLGSGSDFAAFYHAGISAVGSEFVSVSGAIDTGTGIVP